MTIAFDEQSAARILDLSQPPRGFRSRAIACFAVILALAAHAALNGGFPLLAHGAAMSPAGASPQARESAHMKRLMAIGAAAAVMSSGAMAQNAVQWRVEDGGNGHWYRVDGSQLNWVDAQATALAEGGHLATITAANEGAFVWAFMHAQTGTAWLGARAVANACTDASSYLWVTGEVSSYTNWAAGEPNGGFGSQDCAMQFAVDPVQTNLWNDAPIQWQRPSVIEWSADCNNDGIVDYGQIRAGELADANANNIPDCCENGTPCGCAGDTNDDRSVDGIDLATILTRWAQPAAAFPNADCNRDGVIDGNDLAIVLGSWGACP